MRAGEIMADHRRFFVSPEQVQDAEATIQGPTARQIGKVLRLKPDDAITLLDGLGSVYAAEITSLSPDEVRARVLDRQSDINEPRLRLVLACCIPKSDRMELIVQKCTELGISEIVLVTSERTISRLDASNHDRKLDRWRKIALEATEQCGRSKAPVIGRVVTFTELVEMIPGFPLAIVAWEEEAGPSLRDALTENRGSDSALVIIGPEGGLTEREVETAKSAGAVSVSLGRRLLRTDTAAIAACAAVMYELDGEL